MSDYTKATDFAAKDALLTGNPSKVIVGTEIDDEFAAIAVAVNSKYDSTDISNQATAEAGVDNTALMTPLRVAQAIDAQVAGASLISLGVTASAAELNVMEGVTSTTAELNILDGVTATAAQLNTMTGITASTTELNYNAITTLGTAQNSKVVTVGAGGGIDFATKALTNVDINSGSIDGATVGAASHSTGKFTTLQATGALTLGAEVIETVFTVTGTTPALDPANGTVQSWTLTGVSTPTSNLATGESISLRVADGTAYTVTWPSVTWIGGSAPTLALTGYTWVVLFNVGGTLYGVHTGDTA